MANNDNTVNLCLGCLFLFFCGTIGLPMSAWFISTHNEIESWETCLCDLSSNPPVYATYSVISSYVHIPTTAQCPASGARNVTVRWPPIRPLNLKNKNELRAYLAAVMGTKSSCQVSPAAEDPTAYTENASALGWIFYLIIGVLCWVGLCCAGCYFLTGTCRNSYDL